METIIIVLCAGVFAFVIYKLIKRSKTKITGSGGTGGGTSPQKPWTPDYPHDLPDRIEEFRDSGEDRLEKLQ